MDVTILGAGAVGCTYAALLQRGGAEVEVFGRGEHLKTIRRSGLTFEENGKRSNVKLNATARADKLEWAGITLVCVPLHQLVGLQPVIKECSGIIPICNGLTATPTLRNMGPSAVLYGTTVVECYVRDNGWVILETKTPRITIGHELYDYARSTAAFLRGFGLDVSATKKPLSALWQKAAFLIPISLACARWRCDIGGVRDDPERWAVVENLAGGIVAEAERLGHPISLTTAKFALGRVRRGMIPSAARDAIAGKPSELDYLIRPLRHLPEIVLASM